ncbi:hypothetical protein [Microvirga calopogonii]|uniref:hypothetical protein n=1 Tax=Microvirga calopogonii TaxID=2078013 RepID=UPI000E0D05AB|nr:hypothetical protein [Microvirga calopogonii]
MRYSVLATFAVVSIVSTGAFGQCRPVPVQVSVQTPEPQIVLSSTPDVAAAASAPHQLQTLAGWHINGLAQARPSYDLKLQGEVTRDCYRPRAVAVTLGFKEPIQVFIASKYRPGTCEYENIRLHEMQHVRIYRNSIMVYAGRLQFDINNAVASLTPQQLSSAQAQQLSFDRIVEATARVFDQMMEQSRRLNASLDTVENYRYEQARCRNW